MRVQLKYFHLADGTAIPGSYFHCQKFVAFVGRAKDTGPKFGHWPIAHENRQFFAAPARAEPPTVKVESVGWKRTQNFRKCGHNSKLAKMSLDFQESHGSFPQALMATTASVPCLTSIAIEKLAQYRFGKTGAETGQAILGRNQIKIILNQSGVVRIANTQQCFDQ
jgi:hypothetical protein